MYFRFYKLKGGAIMVPKKNSKSVKPDPKPVPAAVPIERRRPLDATIKKQNRYFLAGLLIALGLLIVPMVKMFAVSLIVATTFAALFYPLFRWCVRVLGGRKTLGAFACCAILCIGGLVPTYLVGHLLTRQTIDLFSSAEPKLREIIRKGDEGLLGELKRSSYMRWLKLSNFDWRSSLQEGIKTVATMGTSLINKTSAGVFGAVLNVFITIFTMFYLFLDGDRFALRLRYLSPLRHEYEELIFNRFLQISRATVKATVVIGLMQGTLGALALLICGVKMWLLWGFVMVVLSILPMVGAWLVLIPAAIIMVVTGNIWQGIFIFLFSVLVVSSVDNFVRPRLVGQETRMHDLVIFFATIGGISAFGIMGFIIGPVIAALFVTIVEIYGREFREFLDDAPGSSST
jgi:predicted PurR-regulated permease PerM